MIISYFIAEDGDSPDHPNIFTHNGSSLTLGQLKKVFPVPGEYHFRFKRTVGNIPVWMDATDDSASVPVQDGRVLAKVSRLSLRGVNVHAPPQSHASQPQASAQNGPSASSQKSTPQATSPHVQGKAPEPESSKAPPVRRNSDKLISFDNFDDVPAASQPAQSFDNDFLDFSSTPSVAPKAPSSGSNLDFLGFSDVPHSSTPPIPSMNTGLNSSSDSMHRSHSGNSLNSGMGMGGGMSRGGMNFDAFSNMGTGNNSPMRGGQGGQQQYRGGNMQQGRR